MNNLNYKDWFIVSFAVGILLLIAYITGKKQEDTNDFFIAGRKIPVWLATLSFVATEISAMTIVGVPSIGFSENWQYLQFFIGSAIARIFIGYFFIPYFYKYSCVTIYEFLGHRFGNITQYSASVFFFITRLFASGVRLYAASLAVSVLMGWPLLNTILVFSVISISFIAFGGIKAVIWTGLWETLSFYIAGIFIFVYIFNSTHLSFLDFWRMASEDHKISIINFGLNFHDPNIFLIAILNGIFGSMASFGTDQELMQRLLTLKTREESRKSIIYTIFATIPLVVLYLSIGTGLYIFFKFNPNLNASEPDKILSYFGVNFLPNGLKGLLLSAIILASIDSPLSSLSSSFVMDIYKPLSKENNEKKLLLISRFSILIFGFILALIAYMCQHVEKMLWFAFKVNGLTAGSLLGVFLFGIFTSRKANKINAFSMVFSSIFCTVIMILSEMKIISVGWSWFIIIGTVSTFSISYIFSQKEQSL